MCRTQQKFRRRMLLMAFLLPMAAVADTANIMQPGIVVEHKPYHYTRAKLIGKIDARNFDEVTIGFALKLNSIPGPTRSVLYLAPPIYHGESMANHESPHIYIDSTGLGISARLANGSLVSMTDGWKTFHPEIERWQKVRVAINMSNIQVYVDDKPAIRLHTNGAQLLYTHRQQNVYSPPAHYSGADAVISKLTVSREK